MDFVTVRLRDEDTLSNLFRFFIGALERPGRPECPVDFFSKISTRVPDRRNDFSLKIYPDIPDIMDPF